MIEYNLPCSILDLLETGQVALIIFKAHYLGPASGLLENTLLPVLKSGNIYMCVWIYVYVCIYMYIENTRHTYTHSKIETKQFCLKIPSYEKFSRTDSSIGQGGTTLPGVTICTVDYLPRDCTAEI